MNIIECKEKKPWDRWLVEQSVYSFLQSWDWGEFQRAVGSEPVRLQIVDGEKTVGQIQGFIHRLGFGLRYLYAPQCQMLVDYARESGFAFIRLEPTEPLNLSPIAYRLSPTENRQPRHTLVLDVSQDESALLAGMHPKTRYNIGVAERKGVAVREGAAADIFWQLNEETRARDRFRSHGRGYYEKMLASPLAHQLTAYAKISPDPSLIKEGELVGAPIAANILVHFGDTLTYLHGASSNAHRNLMAPYLLQWEGIRLAKRLGCRWYDLWGVAPPSHKSIETCFHNYCWEAAHSWTGITRFKAGFGGMPVSYGQAVDVVLRPRIYGLYQLVQKIRQGTERR